MLGVGLAVTLCLTVIIIWAVLNIHKIQVILIIIALIIIIWAILNIHKIQVILIIITIIIWAILNIRSSSDN